MNTVWHCFRCKTYGKRVARSERDPALCLACQDKIDADGRKRCRGCNTLQPLARFGKDRHARDGLTSRCATCRAARDAAWRQRNLDRRRASDRAARQRDPERYRAYDRTRRERHGDKRRAQARASYAQHREQRNAYDRQRYQEQREQRLSWQNAYYRRKRTEILATRRRRWAGRKLQVLYQIQGRAS